MRIFTDMPTKKEPRAKICHISDLHLPFSQEISAFNLLSQRMLGYANMKLNRSKLHDIKPVSELIERMALEQADLNIVTGDITNLSFDWEFHDFAHRIESAGMQPENTLIVPGNHDRYTMGADISSAFERNLSRWLPERFNRHKDYPIVRQVGPVLVLAFDTAVWRMPLRASGRIDRGQVQRARLAMQKKEHMGLWPLLVFHHPPYTLTEKLGSNFMRGTEEATQILKMLEGRPATALHGHLHRLDRRRIGSLDVIGIPSASKVKGRKRSRAAYHVYEFSPKGLDRAVAVRFWPEGEGGRFQREEIPVR